MHALSHSRPQWFCVGERLDRLLARAMQGDGDELAFKLVHNLATAGCKPLADKLAPHVPQFVHLLQVISRACKKAACACGTADSAHYRAQVN